MSSSNEAHGLTPWHGTTIIGVKRGDKIVVAGDGQVSMGNTVMKPNARKVRRIGDRARSSPDLPARPPMPSPCSNGWSASWNSIAAS